MKPSKTEEHGRRKIDKEATKAARTKHARGSALIASIFGADDKRAAAQAEYGRRLLQGNGPIGRARYTQRHWTRKGRRAKTKAQRIARRASRA